MQFSTDNGYSIDYKEVANGVFVGIIYGQDIDNGSQAAMGYSVDEVIARLKDLSFNAQIPESVWNDMSSTIKDYRFN
ncbi:hypothetical protein ACHHZC_14365 [Citrobacter freundii complex sp. 2024EL-00228]|jgi:hypothetical protein|uniref:Uncharacterized protein n=1 Tax=Citrobacter freundii TaxID=546 RepID=A0A9P3Z0U6_CITFR|nr:hypothetical protein [Citrobacter freundii]ELK7553244.1 hypothetical protein [Citrobacter freundii]MBJ9313892.1 hypothetical protein [Citrobacter freundii]MDH1411386.1 hypothetical protein [Citrobacter freundii]HAT3654394.1 hypothetical protein [Citrobacter freundii]HAT3737703.1 hypothetical protein [Citrobacter freundii]